MTKSELDKFVGGSSRKNGYDRITKIQPFVGNALNENKVNKFYDYMRKATKRKTPKLSFEVNLDFEEVKVRKKSKIESKGNKKEQKENRETKKVPKKFLKHVLALGFQEEDASLLYENKDSWMSVELDSKIKCTQQGCKFETDMHPNCLVEHCKTAHGWRAYPCSYSGCNWVSHSSYSFKTHIKQFHEGRSSKNLAWKCEFTGCEASFGKAIELKRHTNVHKNISYDCHFCPYRKAQKVIYYAHMNSHYGNRSFKCDFCDKYLSTRSALNLHIESIHEAVQYNCPLCSQTGTIPSMRAHINTRHNVKYFLDRKKKRFVVAK